ncbi:MULTISPECIES: D-ribose pyranase [unclassified Fusibacter]|uniref:D-ribose pyranase n=1 Tax=unclassified Fusibacter TaxID=2624464 RepID=UPI00101074D4|nr:MULTISPECIES: D-ribose pyranase [unclassified Fusibacter]MCK8060734.1 D-ribose pyranase [Fusibacter sp. A2]NPE23029.1 D-ribose pyranase [Fusibacter sp. A1]RXV59703.1 D-ribose pyranase [Fusibacter sp. A1]
MRKGKLLNSNIVSVLAKLGHTDTITIADAGLPIPGKVERIDLALLKGVPSFLETLMIVASDMEIEKITLAEEIKTHNPEVLNVIKEKFEQIEITFVSHEEFKQLSSGSKAIIRTGECTPYANIILQSGVNFEEA